MPVFGLWRVSFLNIFTFFLSLVQIDLLIDGDQCYVIVYEWLEKCEKKMKNIVINKNMIHENHQ